MYHRLVAILCLCMCSYTYESLAATVYRCQDTSGHVTFSSNGCQKSEAITFHTASNLPPSGSTIITKQPVIERQTEQPPQQPREITVVGTQQDGCSNLLSRAERRTAIIHQRVRAGMTLKDVESALGKPDAISETNGAISYRYQKKGRKRTRIVTFDEAGCVISKNRTHKKAMP
ncbi:uncharacterized protein DUF4124 [Pseudomonas duriflava]|uniref:Uncharacterized protein DUF4124 n=1 Tax=Pseudomonas duriflava TaxID=459528 RepID=A0A562Q9V3_9PSED|nr:DUF4124 domain-containing protein [Pseudomonas duriflava]TWI53545.1 uncharacterized protein DUF4124 [Pseudomonas duriflava]